MSYIASKSAVNQFTESLAGDTRGTGIDVFAISPGTVENRMTQVAFAPDWDKHDLWSPPETVAELIERIGSGALDQYLGRYILAAIDEWRSWSGQSLQRDGTR